MLRPTQIIFLGFLYSVTLAADPITPPPGGRRVIDFTDKSSTRLIGDPKLGRGKWVTATGIPTTEAFRAEIPARTKVAWNSQLHIPIKQAFQARSTMLLSFWVRCTQSEDETGSGAAAIYVQSGGDGPRFGFPFAANDQWQQWVRPFAAPADFDPARANITVHLSARAQTIEIAGVELLDYGSARDVSRLPRSVIDYAGRGPDAAWRKTALARIEKIRKGDLLLEVVDKEGNPIPQAKVHVEMRRHEFVFGSAVNVMLLAADKSDFPVTRYRKGRQAARCSWEDAQQYREIVEKYFSRITFEGALRPHVWKLETSDHERFSRQFQVLNQNAIPWLKERDISIRGHYIGWAALDSTPLQRDFVGDAKGHRNWLFNHMADILPKTSPYVYEWDTINHIVGWGHTYEDEHGGPQIHADIMQEARRLVPSAVHAVNEGQVLPGGSRREPYLQVIEFLMSQGQAPDVVGFMGHFGLASLTPPEQVLKVYDRFAKIAPHLQLTELDVDTDGDDQLQADYLRDILIASFSHPNIDAIIQWGFWEKQHWKPGAALWRDDWTLKPAGEVFVDLLTNQWWTDETTSTQADGSCRIRGFLGEYEVKVQHDGATITQAVQLKQQGSRVRIVVP